MSDTNLQEFKADHEGGDVLKGGEVMEPVVGAGGAIKKRLADKMQTVDPEAETVNDNPSGVKTPGNETMKESIDTIFEGMDLSEEFKGKISLVFEAAVNEAATIKVNAVAESFEAELNEAIASVEAELKEEMETALSESIDEIVENLDSYLDYVVAEWMSENEKAIESGIKVEMAESFMEGLKGLFYEHNVEIDEESFDVVAELEEQIAEAYAAADKAINESLTLAEEVKILRAEQIFNELAEGLTDIEAERLRVLSEKLDISDIEGFASDLTTLKESFFKSKKPFVAEQVEEIEDLNEEAQPKQKASAYDHVNAIAAAISSIKK
jgi:hypothetical protein